MGVVCSRSRVGMSLVNHNICVQLERCEKKLLLRMLTCTLALERARVARIENAYLTLDSSGWNLNVLPGGKRGKEDRR